MATEQSQLQHDDVWDFLRGVAMVAVIALHACGPYLARPLTGLLWPVWQPGRAIEVGGITLGLTDAAFWICRGFAVPLFCYVSGIFAARMIARSGPGQFAIRRLLRLGTPLLAGTFIILPLMYYIWAVGWVEMGLIQWSNIARRRFGPVLQPNVYGFCHFWYLWYTLLYCMLLAAVWPLVKRLVDWAACSRMLSAGPIAWSLLIGLGSACVWAMPSAQLFFRNGFLPAPGFFIYHAIFFAWGVLASRRPLPALESKTWIAPVLAALAVVLGIALAAMIGPGLQLRPDKPPPLALTGHRLLLISACGTVQAILMIIALPRLARFQASNWLCTIGQRSLWIYSTHLIWIGLGALALYRIQILPEFKATILFILALAIPHCTQNLVARTHPGRWLGAVLPKTTSAKGEPAPALARNTQ